MPLIPLPTEANDAIDIFVKKLSGENVPICELGHATIHLEAYLWGKFHQCAMEGGGVSAGNECHSTTEVEKKAWLKEQLLKCKQEESRGFGAGVDKIPWKPVLGMVLQFILQWLQTQ